MLIYILCEDSLSKVIIEKMIKHVFPDLNLTLSHFVRLEGKSYIQKKINDINNLSIPQPFFILVDMDKESCAPQLIKQWLKRPCRDNLLFRIAVHELEAWLLADVDGFSHFLQMDYSFINQEIQNPDEIRNPKEKLISLVDRSRKRELKNDMVNKYQTYFRQGSGYNTRLIEFVLSLWNIERAAKKSESLNRSLKALRNWKLK